MMTGLPGKCRGRMVAVAGTVAVLLLFLCLASTAGPASAEDPASPVVPPDRETGIPVSVRVAAIDGLMEGDSSMDGRTSIIDAMCVAQYTVGIRDFDEWQLQCGDTTDDGRVSILDAMHIAQYTVDPTGSRGVLFKDLWEPGSDDSMLPPG